MVSQALILSNSPRLNEDELKTAKSALERAFPGSDGAPQERRPEEALSIVDAEWEG